MTKLMFFAVRKSEPIATGVLETNFQNRYVGLAESVFNVIGMNL